MQTHFHIKLDKFIHSNVMCLFMLPFDWATITLKYSMAVSNIRMHSGITRSALLWLCVFPLKNCHKLCLFEFIHNNKCYHKICDPTIKSEKKNACVFYHRQSKKISTKIGNQIKKTVWLEQENIKYIYIIRFCFKPNRRRKTLCLCVIHLPFAPPVRAAHSHNRS